jgi:cysteine desulfurase/selenocysteine lyase
MPPASPTAEAVFPEIRQHLRQQMPVASKYAYFDHAAVAPLPSATAQAIAHYATQASEGGDLDWPHWSAGVARLRSNAARLIGAADDEIALVSNTTQGIGLVAEGYPWKAGDNVVVPANEFPSNLLPWKNLERRGVELRTVPVEPSGEIDLGRLANHIDRRTRIVSISWVGFCSGYRIDIDKVVELVHQRGSLLMLDAIQGLGVYPLDVTRTPVDFLCADGHKWLLGPEGAGILYVRQEHLNLLQPLGIGWNSLDSGGFDPASTHIKSSASRYEGGSTNMPGMLGLGESVRILQDLGASHASGPIAEAVLHNADCMEEQLRRADLTAHLPAAREHRSGIVPIGWEAADQAGETAYLAARKHCIRRGVVLSVRGGRLRASTHAYNNESDIERLVEALSEFRKQPDAA